MRIVLVGAVVIVLTTITTVLRHSTPDRKDEKASRRSIAIIAGVIGLIGWCGGGALYISHEDAIYTNCLSSVDARNSVRGVILNIVDEFSHHDKVVVARVQALLDRPVSQGGLPTKTPADCDNVKP